jgi:hypothetical protein
MADMLIIIGNLCKDFKLFKDFIDSAILKETRQSGLNGSRERSRREIYPRPKSAPASRRPSRPAAAYILRIFKERPKEATAKRAPHSSTEAQSIPVPSRPISSPA